MKIHGEWQITLVGNVLVQTVAGNFNEEGARARVAELKSCAPAAGPWALLGNASNWDMGNAATLQIVAQAREWMFSHGCICIATVMAPDFRRDVHQKNTGVYSADRYRYFDTLAPACAWLTERGFAISAGEYPHQAFVDRTRIQ